MAKRRGEAIKSFAAHKAMFERLTAADHQSLEWAAEACVKALRAGNKVLLFGNGGSAADAQHIAAELVGRFHRERKALPVMALTVNTSNLTAIANDYSYEEVFARQVEAHARPGDVVVGLSTSGNSPNVVKALKVAKSLGAVAIAFTGQDGGRAAKLADIVLRAPSGETPRIQEMHITWGHILCEIVEADLFGNQKA